ncbi:unnamed protein product [Protopolystoma xenopodis]|uniref:Uncharacterized protein n=1 Tax=Protopolystoma xenopodis TaxID=117903 RepID=A0A448WMN2_9PLAT|nr:unnamed protein product [Protopolystoma xenopodis]
MLEIITTFLANDEAIQVAKAKSNQCYIAEEDCNQTQGHTILILIPVIGLDNFIVPSLQGRIWASRVAEPPNRDSSGMISEVSSIYGLYSLRKSSSARAVMPILTNVKCPFVSDQPVRRVGHRVFPNILVNAMCDVAVGLPLWQRYWAAG